MSQSETEPAGQSWAGVIAVEGWPTNDGRMIEPGVLVWRTPVPLIAVAGWRIIGRVDEIVRHGELIRASGVLFEEVGDSDVSAVAHLTGVTLDRKRSDIALFTAASVRAVALVKGSGAWDECSFNAS